MVSDVTLDIVVWVLVQVLHIVVSVELLEQEEVCVVWLETLVVLEV